MTKTPYSDIDAPYGNEDSKEPYNSTSAPYTTISTRLRYLDAVIDPTMTINGFNVLISGLNYTYQESSRTNATNAILYFTYSTVNILTAKDIITSGATAYPTSLPPTLTAPFTNPDPVPNPTSTATNVVTHPDLALPVFYACLYDPVQNRISIRYQNFNDLSVGDDYLEGTLSQKSFNTSTNEVTLQFKVDTTRNASWFNVDTSTALFDYYTTKIDTTPSVTGDYGYTYTLNANAGGQTAPFDQRYSVSLVDGVPNYNAGNFVIWEWTARVLEYGNLTDYVGNGVYSLTTSTGVTYASSLAMTITDSVIPWVGINSATLTESQLTIVKTYAGWTNSWSFDFTHGGTTTTYTVTGGASTVDLTALSPPVVPVNNDIFVINQPINGTNISITFQKDFTVAYTGTPPNDWTVTVTSVGINFPYTIDIRDAGNNKIDHLLMTSTPTVFDIRTLPLDATNPSHIDWYGTGVVTFTHSGISKTFDASYIIDGDGTNLSGAEIQGYNTTVTNNPYTLTYVETGRLYDAGHTLYYNDYNTGSGTKATLLSDGQTSTTITKTFTAGDFLSGLPLPTTETPIPALNRDVKAMLYDGVSAYSELYSVSKAFDVGDTQLKAYVQSPVFYDGYLEMQLFVNTAQNSVWRILYDYQFQAQYDTNKLLLAGILGASGFGDVISPNHATPDPPYNSQFTTVHIANGLGGGDFPLGTLRFEIYQDITDSDITALNFGFLGDLTGNDWKTDLAITPASFSINAKKIDSFTYTKTSMTITKNVTDAFNWSYRIDGGATVIVGGAVGLTQTVTGLSFSNGQLIEVFQPYFAGSTLSDTTTGVGTAVILRATFDGASFPSGNDIDPTSGTSGLTYTQSTQYAVPFRELGDYSCDLTSVSSSSISNVSDMDSVPNGISFAFWFKYDGTGTPATPFTLFRSSSYGATADQGFNVYLEDNGLSGVDLGVYSGSAVGSGVSWASPILASANALDWTHIIITLDTSGATLVVNGDYFGLPSSTSGYSLASYVTGQSIILGENVLIDDFKMYNGALTGMTTIPISGEALIVYDGDNPEPIPELRATFEGATHGTDPNDIAPVTATYDSVTPSGTTAKQGTKVADLGLLESAPVKIVSVPNYTGINTVGYTVSFWFYFKNSAVTSQGIIGSTGGTNKFALYYESSVFFRTYVILGSTFYTLWLSDGSVTLTDGTWNHIVYYSTDTRAGTWMYLNGVEVPERSTSYPGTAGQNKTSYTYSTGQSLTVGDDGRNLATADLDQYADDLRIYHRELNKAEITALYNSY